MTARSRRSSLAACLAVSVSVVVVALPAQSWAYVRTTTEHGHPMRWANPDVPLIVYLGSPPSGLTREQVETAVNTSAATWSNPAVPCTGLRLLVTPLEEANGPAVDDRQNRISFRRELWRRDPCDPAKPGDCNSYDPQALAITSVLAVRRTGKIVDADMELNATAGKRWADLDTYVGPRGSAHDLRNTITHELGHLIGLDHNCIDSATRGMPKDHQGNLLPFCTSAPADIRASTMFNVSDAGDIAKRDLAPDDAQAVCDIYPFGQGIVDLDLPPEGGCRVSPPVGAPAASASSGSATALLTGGVLLAAALRRRRRSQSPRH